MGQRVVHGQQTVLMAMRVSEQVVNSCLNIESVEMSTANMLKFIKQYYRSNDTR